MGRMEKSENNDRSEAAELILPRTNRDTTNNENNSNHPNSFHSSSQRPRWSTVDGSIGPSEEESISYARRFFKFGFFLLPFLWAVNCFYFWPVLRHSRSFPLLRRYVVGSALGFTVFAAVLSSWALAFSIGGEHLFGHIWDDLVMYNVAERFGLTGFWPLLRMFLDYKIVEGFSKDRKVLGKSKKFFWHLYFIIFLYLFSFSHSSANLNTYSLSKIHLGVQGQTQDLIFQNVFLSAEEPRRFFKVYNGNIPEDNAFNLPAQQVAVKVARQLRPEDFRQFPNELNILQQLPRHPNIINLVGQCQIVTSFSLVLELAGIRGNAS